MYVESAADHAFTAFLASLTPGRVLRDRMAMFSKPERKRITYLREKSAYERARDRQELINIQLRIAREMRNQ